MKRLSVLLALLSAVAITSEGWAKRTAPKPVAPVVDEGVKYVAQNANGREGRVEAHSERTGEKLWDAVIYTVKIDRNLEADVQWVFITKLAVRNGKLLVTNEKGEKYVLDLKTRKVEKATDDANRAKRGGSMP